MRHPCESSIGLHSLLCWHSVIASRIFVFVQENQHLDGTGTLFNFIMGAWKRQWEGDSNLRNTGVDIIAFLWERQFCSQPKNFSWEGRPHGNGARLRSQLLSLNQLIESLWWTLLSHLLSNTRSLRPRVEASFSLLVELSPSSPHTPHRRFIAESKKSVCNRNP